MITDLDYLCRGKPIIAALHGKFDKDITEFIKELSHFIHGYGSIGYEDAERTNLKTNGEYTPKEAKDLLAQIRQTRRLPKNALHLAAIDEVPYGMAQKLAMESDGLISDVRKGEIRFGILRGHELIGYVCADQWRNEISIHGLFVREDYRGKGHSTRLLELMMNKAEREELNGISLPTASWAGQDALRGLKKKYDCLGRKDVTFRQYSEDLGNYAELYFTERI